MVCQLVLLFSFASLLTVGLCFSFYGVAVFKVGSCIRMQIYINDINDIGIVYA